MAKIRIQNDITLRVTVTRQGKEEDFSLKDLRLVVRSMLDCQELAYTVSGNVLTAVWLGTAQTKTGTYTVTLVEDYGNGSRNTVDSCGAFTLVSRSCQESDALTGDQIVDLDLDVSVPGNGLSAYELALLNGYSGTEAEWLASLSQDSKDAAATATAAAESASTAAAYATAQGDYAKAQGDYAKAQGDYAKEQAASAETAAAEATEATEKTLTAAEVAERLNANQPKIVNGTWWVYDVATGEYVDTEAPATGSVLYPTFHVNTSDMCLYMVYEDATAANLIKLDTETGQLYLVPTEYS